MKKLTLLAVGGALILASCGQKKDFCECLKEAMASESETAPAGCEYIEKMSEEEAGKKVMECMGDLMKMGMEGMGEAFDGMGEDFDDAVEEYEEIEEEVEEMED
jgi:hypothetical protein